MCVLDRRESGWFSVGHVNGDGGLTSRRMVL